MINAAGDGYAMKNSAPELLQKVENITEYSNDDQGVQQKINDYLN